MNYSESSDAVLEKEKETYTKGTEKYRLANEELKKRKRKRSRPKEKPRVYAKKKTRDQLYLEAYGMTCKQIRELLGFKYSGTTLDLHKAGLLKLCISRKKMDKLKK